MQNVLFICSRNQWRSPTAETVFRKYNGIQVRSAGTSPRARRTVNVNDIRWADVILVMEQKHKNRIKAEFTQMIQFKRIEVLDIPDDYKYMDPELIEILESAVPPFLEM
ncbi:MAG: hypothetical protein RLN81_15675 [Balneolaceae bacterium]